MQVVGLGEIVMILDLKRQGLGVSAIARQTGLDRKTVRKYLERGLEVPVYGPREPGARLAERFRSYLAERLEAFPGLSGRRLHREIRVRRAVSAPMSPVDAPVARRPLAFYAAVGRRLANASEGRP